MKIQTIEFAAERAGLELSSETLEQIQLYIARLLEKNKVMNLTAITEENEIADSHLLDSFLLLPYVRGTSMIDVGTGAGFPGLLVKLLRPELNVVLLDSTKKRISFLEEIIDELALSQITAVHGRAEELAHKPEYREQFDTAVARAVSALDILVELCLPLVRPGGRFLAMKGKEDELELAAKAIPLLGGGKATADHYLLPGTDIQRSMVIVPKEKPTKQRYPRPFAAIKKFPL
ncbi:MAG: 16S rRNA (guanine(527)-N(7))-methyltransferase RsmG [Eubacteriales bacterium]|nr:16S rRNA (guanine(527)-N(7))-methyltransferase RsmG [Eubacteriales bacterium]MDD4541704.1 16S rRNA (guanine(527)-N(7))-methyltransferase RsmG [Eubacteriales bacterium]